MSIQLRLFSCILGCLTLFYSPFIEAKESPRTDLALYYSPYCPHCIKVLDYLHEIHKTVPLKDVASDIRLREELIKIGGKGQVPCLVIGSYPLYESDAIIQWLKAHQEELPNEP